MQRGGCNIVRTFLVSSDQRDKTKYPHPSEFSYELPITISNVVGMSVRDFQFKRETLVNENNRYLSIYADDGAVDGTVTLTSGDFDFNLTTLLAEVNDKIRPYDIQFSLDENVNRIVLTFSGNFVDSYITIQPNSILRALGFSSGICLYRTTPPVNLASNITAFQTSAVADKAYDIWISSNLVMRITDVECIMSNDSTTNRSSAILFTDISNTYTVMQNADYYYPLLQIQHRLKTLRFKLLNMEGDLYDTVNHGAVFLLDFYCKE